VEEHQKSMQVNIFEGYAVFDIQEKKKTTDKSIEKAKEPSTEDESGQSSTPEGQLDLFSTDQENTQALPNE